MMHDADFDIPIEVRFFNLLPKALDKKLFIRYEMHIDSKGFKVLMIKIYPIDREPKCLYVEIGLPNMDLYFKINHFIEEYSHEEPKKEKVC